MATKSPTSETPSKETDATDYPKPPEPPKKRGPGRPPKAKTATEQAPKPKRGPGRPPAPKLDQLLGEQFNHLAGALGVAAAISGSSKLAFDAEVIANNAEKLAQNIDKVTLNSPKLRKAMIGVCTSGAYMELAITVGSIAIPIMANHEMLPPQIAGLFGMPVPQHETNDKG